MKENSTYYKGKLIKLFNKLFLNPYPAKQKFIKYEVEFNDAYDASIEGTPKEIQIIWHKIWQELNKKEPVLNKKGHIVFSKFHQTVSSKHNKTLEKYLFFILEEKGRLTDLIIHNTSCT